MMPAPYSADLRWRVIWFVYILQNSVAEASFFLGVCQRTVERFISKFLVNGYVKPEPVGRTAVSVLRHAKNLLFLHTKYGNHSSFRQLPFAVLADNVF